VTSFRVPAPPPSAFPSPEPVRTRALVRTVAVLAILMSCAYLTWRALETIDLAVWWIALPLLLLEAHAAAGLVLHTIGLWDLDSVGPPAPVEATDLRLAVLIPTYDEPLEVLLPTVAAAVAVRLPHQTWVLDDGARPEVAELATRLGARYLAREEHAHAKAGNVNHALGVIEADVMAVLDADHVALPDLFRNTLGHFDDPAVAFVQTPQDFYNVDSFEHTGTSWTDRAAAYRYSEQALFYRGLQPGRNRWGAAFCCGTGALFRTDALRAVGGLAVETVTEDIHTSIRLHRRGWRSIYHNEVLARGLAAADARQYLEQRLRWGTGAMQVLRTENPLVVGGLRPMQRVSYLSTLVGWFDSWRTLGYLLAPMVVVLTGVVPIRAQLLTLLAWFLPAVLLQVLALRLLGRGLAPQGTSTVFELVRMPANLQATLRLVSGKARGFTVTAKGRTGSTRSRTRLHWLHTGLLGLSGLCAVWFVATTLGHTPLSYEVTWAANGAAMWMVVNSVLLVIATRRIRQERYGAERRSAVRFPVAGTAEVGGTPGALYDASLTGFRVAVPVHRAPEAGAVVRVRVPVPDGSVDVDVVVRSSAAHRSDGGGELRLLGLEVLPGQVEAQARLSLALFAGGEALPALPVPTATAAIPHQRVPERPLPGVPSAVPAAFAAGACVDVLPARSGRGGGSVPAS
jgi:cellulose synthase (UDP-forming)